ncbi:hypothetical protein GF351_01570 [Candidatus Woesearchaeota archaeon]|nr:hypothetical protein [Candidatus Woesearchaeota archaeon]
MAKAVSDKKGKEKKRWYPVLAPKIFNEQVIGETLLYDPQHALGRTTTANLMHLTGDVRKQNITLKFEVNAVEDNKILTIPKAYEMGYSSIKRFVRRRQDKLEDSLLLKTADGKEVRIKPLVITRSTTKGSVKHALRQTLRKEIISFVKKNTFEALFNEIIMYKMQMNLKSKLNEIYPIKICEIRALKEERVSPLGKRQKARAERERLEKEKELERLEKEESGKQETEEKQETKKEAAKEETKDEQKADKNEVKQEKEESKEEEEKETETKKKKSESKKSSKKKKTKEKSE